ncbi:MAG: hypothetical protein QOG67_3056 [Verrucomicrobiota bacterium]|jgi:hypothetical protein
MATKTQRNEEGAATRTITKKYADDVPLIAADLAKAMRVSRWTIGKWKANGYVFLYGKMTTQEHVKAWLKTQAAKGKPVIQADEALRLDKKLNELR